MFATFWILMSLGLAADMIGSETSSRNSEVMHAGIYYPTGTFKAKACVEGKLFLYDYCTERGVPHKRLGKLIVACAETPQAPSGHGTA